VTPAQLPEVVVTAVLVNGVPVARNANVQVQRGQDANVTVTCQNKSGGNPTRVRGWLTNVGPGCQRTQQGCYAEPTDPGVDGHGGQDLNQGQSAQYTMIARGVTTGLTLQAEAQPEDGCGQYRIEWGDTWPFTISVPGAAAPPASVGGGSSGSTLGGGQGQGAGGQSCSPGTYQLSPATPVLATLVTVEGDACGTDPIQVTVGLALRSLPQTITPTQRGHFRQDVPVSPPGFLSSVTVDGPVNPDSLVAHVQHPTGTTDLKVAA
jgi:hypothetical protein